MRDAAGLVMICIRATSVGKALGLILGRTHLPNLFSAFGCTSRMYHVAVLKGVPFCFLPCNLNESPLSTILRKKGTCFQIVGWSKNFGPMEHLAFPLFVTYSDISYWQKWGNEVIFKRNDRKLAKLCCENCILDFLLGGLHCSFL